MWVVSGLGGSLNAKRAASTLEVKRHAGEGAPRPTSIRSNANLGFGVSALEDRF